jgi:hypothetical protein
MNGKIFNGENAMFGEKWIFMKNVLFLCLFLLVKVFSSIQCGYSSPMEIAIPRVRIFVGR